MTRKNFSLFRPLSTSTCRHATLLWVILVSIGSLLVTPVKALDTDKDLTQCRLETWTAKDGLPARDIEAMAQTPDGYLWLATDAGLVRFDGVNFKIFSSTNTPGLAHNTVLSVAVDAKGTLWAGTDWDGFGTQANGKFNRVQVNPDKKETGWSEYRALYLSKAGEMWAGGAGGGTYGVVRNAGNQTEWMKNLTGARAFQEDKQGNLFVADYTSGLYQRNSKGIWNLDKSKQSLTALCLDKTGTLWIGSERDGLFRSQNGKYQHFTTQNGLSSNIIHALFCDLQGNLWIGTHQGLNRYQNGKFTAFHRADGLFSENVNAILEDHEGSLWVASGSGLNRFTNTLLTPFQIQDRTGFTTLRGVSPAKQGGLWLSTSQGFLHSVNGVLNPLKTQDGEPVPTVSHFFEDKSGTLWLSTDKNGFCIFRNGKLTRINNLSFDQFTEDAHGIVAVNGGDVWRFDHQGRGHLLVNKVIGYSFQAFTDRQGIVWIGGTNGLGRVTGDCVDVLSAELPKETHILGLTEDSERGLWLATDKGLIRYRDNHFTVFGKPQGLPDDNLFQIQEDNHQTLWIGGRFGIFSVKKSEFELAASDTMHRIAYTLYSGSDGIRSFPILNSTFKMKNGIMAFTGDTSVTLVNPDALTTNPMAPNVLIEQVKGDTRSLNFSTKVNEIEAGTRDLEIAYTGLSLAAPEKMRFRYRLQGYDKDWVEVGNRRSAYYTNLPPGNYIFQVLACNNDGVWSRVTATLPLKMQPFFYQTTLFQVVCVGAVIGGCGLLFGLRTHRLKQINHLLETKVANRTAQLLQSKHSLEETLEELHASKEELEAANARLEALATTDGMTELANHRAFQERLQLETRPLGQTKRMALLLLDVDHFKQYNDAFGHPAGDEALRIVGKIIRENVRRGDFPARYGGEEFAALLPQATPEGALMVAERIRTAIETHEFPHRVVTVSIGVSFWSAEEPENASLVQRADTALYRAKHNGRNCIVSEQEIERETLPKAA